jgi:DNA-binding transcriptional LysR family regulator
MLLNLNRIELFVTVAKHQKLAKTAQEMHVSASSVCQRLKSLENDFGVKLYKKNKEGIELTGAGQTLLTTASDVLNQLENLRKTLNRDSQTPVQSLTIGGTYNPSAKHLPSAIAAFQKTHPGIKVRFITSDRISIEKLVRESEVDVAIVQSASRPSDININAEHFSSDNLSFFAHPGHPLAKNKRLGLADLSQAPLIIRDTRSTIENLFKQLEHQGLTLNVTLRCISPEAVKAAVRRKMGVGVLFYNHIDEDVKRKDLKILKFAGFPKFVGNSYIVYSKSKPLSCAAGEFLTLLRSMKTPLKNSVNISDANNH